MRQLWHKSRTILETESETEFWLTSQHRYTPYFSFCFILIFQELTELWSLYVSRTPDNPVTLTFDLRFWKYLFLEIIFIGCRGKQLQLVTSSKTEQNWVISWNVWKILLFKSEAKFSICWMEKWTWTNENDTHKLHHINSQTLNFLTSHIRWTKF